MMAGTRYTAFPKLHPCQREVASVEQWRCVEINHGMMLDAETIIVSWSRLLQCYTEQDDVCFTFNQETIIANVGSTASWTRVPQTDVDLIPDTGILFTERFSHEIKFPRLYFQQDVNFEHALLWTSIDFPESQLVEIGLQFKDILCSINSGADTVFKQCKLSVLQPHPSVEEGPRLLHHLVGLHAIPEATAVDHLQENKTRTSLSYAQLDQYSSLLASEIGLALQQPHLLDKHDEVVPILLPQGTELYVAILATLKAGAAFCPLGIDSPSERLKYIVNDVNASVVVTSADLANKIPRQNGCKVIPFDLSHIRLSRATFTARPCEPQDLAYVMYTSGTTGTPKGVGLSHFAATQALLAHQTYIPSFHRFLQFAAPTFDVSVFEIFFSWFRGATLVSCDKFTLLNDLPTIMNAMQVDAAELTPTVTSALLKNRKNVPGLKVLLTIGEMLTKPVIDEFGGSKNEPGILHGLYGPTEATIHCTMAPSFSRSLKPGVIGYPLPTVSAFIVAINLRPPRILPVGHVGELAIGGHQLAHGYLNRPDQNEAAFVEHEKFGRLYLTGDKARLLPDGVLECLGRINSGQVKLRGQRVELGEVEQVLLNLKTIQSAIATVIQDNLIVFCVRQDLQVNESDLWRHAKEWLPSYMIPMDIVFLNSLPLLTSGKVDIKMLQSTYALDASVSHSSTQNAAPTERSETSQSTHISRPYEDAHFRRPQTSYDSLKAFNEKQIAKVLGETLTDIVEGYDPKTSFFRLGMNSLTAIAFARNLRAALPDTHVDVPTILLNPSIERMAASMSTNKAVVAPTQNMEHNIIDVFQGETQRMLKAHYPSSTKFMPCTPLQEAMLSATSQASTSYINRTIFNVTGDVSKLRHAWQHMLERHEILRTCFITTKEKDYAFAQVVLSSTKLPWTCSSVSETSWSESDQDMEQHAWQLLDTGHLGYRLAIFERKDNEGGIESSFQLTDPASADEEIETQLHLYMHHALYDANALSRLIWEVEQIYKAMTLPPAPNFGPFLQDMISSSTESAHVHWDSMLRGFQPCFLTDGSKPQSRSAANPSCFELSVSLSNIEKQCKDLSTSLASLCQASWSKVLMQFLNTSDICFGNVVSGRNTLTEGVEDLIAPCFNTIPLRARISSGLSNLQFVNAIQSTIARSLPFQLSSLRYIQASHSPDGMRLFDTLLLLQQPKPILDPAIWSIQSDSGQIEFPLVCELQPEPVTDRLSILLHCQASLLSSLDTHSIYNAFEAAFQSFLYEPDSLIELSKNETPDSRTVPNLAHGRGVHEAPTAPNESKMKPQSTALYLAKVRQILAELSGRPFDAVQPHISLFRLGLDSINAVQVAAQLRAQGFDITTRAVLENATIEGLASLCAVVKSTPTNAPDQSTQHRRIAFDCEHFTRTWIDKVSTTHKVVASSIHRIRPCTAFQAGVIAQSISSDKPLYVNHMTYKLSPDVDVARLAKAWHRIFEHFEILRTGFASIDSPHHPFVMLTYKSNSINFSSLILTALDDQKIFEPRTVQQDILRNLHGPAWRLRMEHAADRVRMHLIMHHAVFDGYSLDLILKEVQCAYDAKSLTSGADIDLAWEHIFRSGSDTRDKARAFWQKHATHLIRSPFPVLAPSRGAKAATKSIQYKSNLTVWEFSSACANLDVTMQVAGQAAWAKVLAAYVGENKVTFGTVYSGRLEESTQSSALPCIFTRPVAIDVSGDQQSLFQTLTEFNIAAESHGSLSLRQIDQWIGHEDGELFDTLFVFQRPSEDGDEYSLWTLEHEAASVEYPISIELIPRRDGVLLLCFAFESSIIPEDQAKLIVAQLDLKLCEIVRPRMNQTLDAFDRTLFSLLPAKENELPSDINLLHNFVGHGARSTQDKIALEFVISIGTSDPTVQRWTYKQLNKLGNNIANWLISRGVGQGSVVGICFEKCPEAYFAILGILKAGCSFLALDPEAPLARKQFILKDSKAAMLLTHSSLEFRLDDDILVESIDLDKVAYETFSCSEPSLLREIRPQDLAYCLYTSGTTGTPKGCRVSHENVVQVFLAFRRLYRHTSTSRFLQFASFHFDVSVMEQYWSWSVGICCVAAPRDVIFEDIARAIRELQITHIDLTPSLARTVHPDDVPSLCQDDSVFITGGEPIKQDIIDLWGPKHVIHNAYGPTEVTIGLSMNARLSEDARVSNIGHQFDNVGCYVFEPNTMTPVLRGAVGELCVCGKLVAQGYINRPLLTAEKFPTIDGLTGKERLYRTGDLVRVLHDNSFEFIGRVDDQIKLRGQRLESSEINSVIKQSSAAILDVATLNIKRGDYEKDQLVSFVVIKNSPEVQGSECRDVPTGILKGLDTARTACRSSLPRYMIPIHLVPLKALPLSNNNKADHQQLRRIFSNISRATLHSLTKRRDEADDLLTDKESQVIEVLSSIQDLPQDLMTSVNRFTSVFELGLDSIAVIGFSRRLKKAGYHNATPAVVMKHHTVADLTEVLEYRTNQLALSRPDPAIRAAKHMMLVCQQSHKAQAARRFGVDKTNIECIAPCTPLQQGIISESLTTNIPLYHMAFHYELDHDVDLDHLRSAFVRLVESLQILRTWFLLTSTGYVQVVLRHIDMPWLEEEVQSDDIDHEYLLSLRDQWFQADSGHFRRPYEIHLIRTKTKSVLGLHIFHALYDGISLGLLQERLLELYHADHKYSRDTPSFHSVLPYGPLKTSDSAFKFWSHHLSIRENISKNSIARDPSSHSITRVRTLKNLTQFEISRKKLAITHQAMFQACWIVVLQKRFGTPVILGVVASGRSIDFERVDEVIGPLFNTVPFNIFIAGSDTWSDAARRCHESNVNILPFQHTALRDINKSLGSGNELQLRNLFVFQKRDTKKSKLDPIWAPVGSLSETTYPIALEVEYRNAETYDITLATQAGFSDKATCDDMLDDFEKALDALLRSGDSAINESMDITKATSRMRELESSSAQHLPALQPSSPINTSVGQWDRTSRLVQAQIATLAGVDIDDVRLDTSILEVGLDSVDAIQLCSRLRSVCQLCISVSSIMREPTCQAIARNAFAEDDDSQHVATRLSKRTEESLEKLKVGLGPAVLLVEEVLPVTPLQQTMVAEMISSEYSTYYNHSYLRLNPDVDIGKLKSAWQDVVNKTPILRTSFHMHDDTASEIVVAQLVQRPDAIFWGSLMLDDLDNLDEAAERVRLDVQRADHQAHPLLRLTFLESSDATPSNPILMLSLPHAMYDGISLEMLHGDVQRAYGKTLSSRPSYTVSLAAIDRAAESREHEGFWQDFLEDYTPIPIARSGGLLQGQQQVNRAELRSTVSQSSINDFCKSHGITLGALAQTAWAFLLASMTRTLDIAFGVVVSGRHDEDENEMSLPLMNTIVVRALVHGSLGDMTKYMQDTMSAIGAHDRYPLRKIQALAVPWGKPLFDTLFIHQRRRFRSDQPAQALYEEIGGASNVEYPVCIEIETSRDSFLWRIACYNEVFNKEDTPQVLRELDMVLARVLAESEVQAVQYLEDGKVSVCGLVAFSEDGQQQDAQATKASLNTHMPSDKALEVVATVLANVARLRPEDVMKDSSIYELGLDSISAIKVSSLLRKEHLFISVSEILKAETVLGIASHVERAQGKPSPLPKVDARAFLQDFCTSTKLNDTLKGFHSKGPSNVEAVLPATPGQSYMMDMHQKFGHFKPTFTCKIQGSCLSVVAVSQAWRCLIQQVPALRTYFVCIEPRLIRFAQVIFKSLGVQTIRDNVRDNLKSTQQHLIEPHTPFVSLYISVEHTSGDPIAIHLCIHHALYDATSLHVLTGQFTALLRHEVSSQLALQSKLALPSGSTGPVIYSDATEKTYTTSTATALFLFSIYSSTAISARKDFWTQYLASHVPSVPAAIRQKPISGHPIGGLGARISDFRPAALSKMQTEALKVFARKMSVSLAAVVLAIYAASLRCGTLSHNISASHAASVVSADVVNAKRRLDEAINPSEDVLVGIYTRIPSSSDSLPDVPTLNIVPLLVRSTYSTETRQAPLMCISDCIAKAAKAIQADLTAIQQDTRSAVSVQELREWIGEKAIWDVTFNFLVEESGAGDVDDVDEEEDAETDKHAQHDIIGVKKDEENAGGAKETDIANLQLELVDPASEVAQSRQSKAYPVQTDSSRSADANSPYELQSDNAKLDAYKPSIDLEARVSPSTGCLDLGIFGWEGLSLDLASDRDTGGDAYNAAGVASSTTGAAVDNARTAASTEAEAETSYARLLDDMVTALLTSIDGTLRDT